MKVNFVYDTDTLSPLKSNITGQLEQPFHNSPYWLEWGFNINKHLLSDKHWVPTRSILKCNLTSVTQGWDLYSRVEILKNTPYLIHMDIKLDTAANCNIFILEYDTWRVLGKHSFNKNDQEWHSFTVEMLPSESPFIHLHIGSVEGLLPTQEEGSVFIKNLRAVSETTDTPVVNIMEQNGSILYEYPSQVMLQNILLSEIDEYKHDFNVYPIVIKTSEYVYCWPLLLLSRKVVDLVNEDRLKILFVCSFEPIKDNILLGDQIDFYSIHCQVSKICGIQGIQRIDNIIFTATDSTIEERLEQYKEKLPPDSPLIKFKDINAYGHLVPKILHREKNIDWLEVYCKNYTTKPYSFLYLNNRMIYSRYVLYKHMEYKQLLQYGIFSWRGFQQQLNRALPLPTYVDASKDETRLKFKNYVASNPDIEVRKIEDDVLGLDFDPLVHGAVVNSKWIEDTYFSVVTETHVGNMPSHVTEKIYKLIFYCHPFIVIGPKNHLATLHRYGFKTFPELFDESYDSMPDSFEKYDFITDQIKFYTTDEGKKKLEQIFPIIRSTLEYNRKHLLSLSSDDIWNSLPELYE